MESGARQLGAPDARLDGVVDALVRTLAARRGWSTRRVVDELGTELGLIRLALRQAYDMGERRLFDQDLDALREALLQAYQLGTEHADITAEHPAMPR